jgi:hypothetical protein
MGFALGLGELSALGALEYRHESAYGPEGLSAVDAFSLPLGISSSMKAVGLEIAVQVGAYYQVALENEDAGVHHGAGIMYRVESSACSTIDPLSRFALFFGFRYGCLDIDAVAFRFLDPYKTIDFGLSFRF